MYLVSARIKRKSPRQQNYQPIHPTTKPHLTRSSETPRALGAPTSNLEIHSQYPLAFRTAFASTLSPKNNTTTNPPTKPFRFILLSGALVIRDQTTLLPPGLSALKQRGLIETDFLEFEDNHKGVWESVVARPAMVVVEGGWAGWVLPAGFAIGVGRLGRGLVRVAVEGVSGGGGKTIGNGGLRELGREG